MYWCAVLAELSDSSEDEEGLEEALKLLPEKKKKKKEKSADDLLEVLGTKKGRKRKGRGEEKGTRKKKREAATKEKKDKAKPKTVGKRKAVETDIAGKNPPRPLCISRIPREREREREERDVWLAISLGIVTVGSRARERERESRIPNSPFPIHTGPPMVVLSDSDEGDLNDICVLPPFDSSPPSSIPDTLLNSMRVLRFASSFSSPTLHQGT